MLAYTHVQNTTMCNAAESDLITKQLRKVLTGTHIFELVRWECRFWGFASVWACHGELASSWIFVWGNITCSNNNDYFLIEMVRFSVEPKQVMYLRIKTPMSPGLRLINKCGCAALEFAVANFFKGFNQIL